MIWALKSIVSCVSRSNGSHGRFHSQVPDEIFQHQVPGQTRPCLSFNEISKPSHMENHHEPSECGKYMLLCIYDHICQVFQWSATRPSPCWISVSFRVLSGPFWRRHESHDAWSTVKQGFRQPDWRCTAWCCHLGRVPSLSNFGGHVVTCCMCFGVLHRHGTSNELRWNAWILREPFGLSCDMLSTLYTFELRTLLFCVIKWQKKDEQLQVFCTKSFARLLTW